MQRYRPRGVLGQNGRMKKRPVSKRPESVIERVARLIEELKAKEAAKRAEETAKRERALAEYDRKVAELRSRFYPRGQVPLSAAGSSTPVGRTDPSTSSR
jgi:hypothetical protein